MELKTLFAASALMVSMTATAQTGKGGTWTLDDCLDYAMKNNISLQKQQIARLSATEDVKQSQKALLPTLSASTSQMFGWRPWINDQTTTVANGTITNKISKTYYNGSYGVNANWTVWNGNRNRNTIKANRQAELQLQDSEKQLWSTIEGYWIDATTNQQKFRSAQVSVERQRKQEASAVRLPLVLPRRKRNNLPWKRKL